MTACSGSQLAGLGGGGRVLAFEPAPDSAAKLRATSRATRHWSCRECAGHSRSTGRAPVCDQELRVLAADLGYRPAGASYDHNELFVPG